MMVKYNLYFTTINMNFDEVFPLIESFISTYYEERSFKYWSNSMIMNSNPVQYMDFLNSRPKEVNINNNEIKSRNEEILKSFKKEV